jgi:hypothetical protein
MSNTAMATPQASAARSSATPWRQRRVGVEARNGSRLQPQRADQHNGSNATPGVSSISARTSAAPTRSVRSAVLARSRPPGMPGSRSARAAERSRRPYRYGAAVRGSETELSQPRPGRYLGHAVRGSVEEMSSSGWREPGRRPPRLQSCLPARPAQCTPARRRTAS